MSKIVKIIDYKAGNAPSVMHAVRRLGFEAEFAALPRDLENSSPSKTCIILPGVGSAGATMRSLQETGMAEELSYCVMGKKIPFLGVCVGMQVLFEHSEEEDASCFGWLKGKVVKFDSSLVRVPQMGWNEVRFNSRAGASKSNAENKVRFSSATEAGKSNADSKSMLHSPAPAEVNKSGYFYFVNSYYALPLNKNDTWGIAHYGSDFCAAVKNENIYGTQFHIEKSGEAGLKLLREFIESC